MDELRRVHGQRLDLLILDDPVGPNCDLRLARPAVNSSDDGAVRVPVRVPALDAETGAAEAALEVARQIADDLARRTLTAFLRTTTPLPDFSALPYGDDAGDAVGSPEPVIPAGALSPFVARVFGGGYCRCNECRYIRTGVEPEGNIYREDLLLLEARRSAHLGWLAGQEPRYVAFSPDDLRDIRNFQATYTRSDEEIGDLLRLSVVEDKRLEDGEVFVCSSEEAFARGYAADVVSDEAGAVVPVVNGQPGSLDLPPAADRPVGAPHTGELGESSPGYGAFEPTWDSIRVTLDDVNGTPRFVVRGS